jgi:hypothetical protein
VEAPPAAVNAKPQFDVQDLFDRAQKVMKDRAQSVIMTYQSDIKNNYAEFERSLLRQSRRVKNNGRNIEGDLKAALTEWQEEDGKISANLSGYLASIDEVAAIHRENYQKQVGIEDTFNEALAQLSATYILGLELQIERLEPENDPAAIALIQEEIKRTREDRPYFQESILGLSD